MKKTPFTLIKNTKLHFHYNPFGGLMEDEIGKVIQVNFSLEDLQKLLEQNPAPIVEFVGKKGRGKTTHLKYFHSFFLEAALFLLSGQDKVFPQESAKLVFVDSIHHWSLRQRLRFYREQKAIVLTTHHSRKWEYALSKRASTTIYFKGIEVSKLEQILSRRIQLATGAKTTTTIQLDLEYIQQLIAHFGDDYRGILNFLYKEFNRNT